MSDTLHPRVIMALTPDDSALLKHMGIVFLLNIANLSTLTLLHGNNATIYPVDALTFLYQAYS